MTAPTTSARRDGAASTPIADLALVSDCNSAALIDRDGTVQWLCLPRFDSPALFAGILDPAAGHWSIRPVGPYTSGRCYREGSLVLETTFVTANGTVRLVDALVLPTGQRDHDLGLDAPHELLRLVEGVDGMVDMTVELAPRPEYGLVRPLVRLTPGGAVTFGAQRVAIAAGVPLALDDATLTARCTVRAGEAIAFALRAGVAATGAEPLDADVDVARARLDDTTAAWRSWEAHHEIYDSPHRDLVRLSARVLQGLTYRPSGAIVAAPTCSLAETVGGERNWDYRYCWVRDASLTVEALHIGACAHEVTDFVSFMTSAAGGRVVGDAPLQIMYGIGGEHDLTERTLPHLRGWRDSSPVRVGNDAWTQEQLDVYGELLACVELTAGRLDDLHPEIQQFLADLADAAMRRWTRADAGMWEMRGAPQHHLSSKLLCWVALDRALRLAPRLGAYARADEWAAERDRIAEEIVTRGWSERRGAFAQAFDSDELDAAALLMPVYGFLPATDPRMRATIEAIARDLTDDGLVLRYRNGDGLNADGLMGEEGTFVICSFWLVSCLAMAGEIERAEELFDRLAGYANDLGLLAEEIDHRTGELLGNFPQAFSHIGLIRAAADIDAARGRR